MDTPYKRLKENDCSLNVSVDSIVDTLSQGPALQRQSMAMHVERNHMSIPAEDIPRIVEPLISNIDHELPQVRWHCVLALSKFRITESEADKIREIIPLEVKPYIRNRLTRLCEGFVDHGMADRNCETETQNCMAKYESISFKCDTYSGESQQEQYKKILETDIKLDKLKTKLKKIREIKDRANKVKAKNSGSILNQGISEHSEDAFGLEFEEFNPGKMFKHKRYGLGIIIKNDTKHITVDFSGGNVLRFSIMKCLETSKPSNPTDSAITVLSVEELKRVSDNFNAVKRLDKYAVSINQRIIDLGSRDAEYFLRLARGYKNTNQMEEATEIYKEVLIIDKRNKEAKDHLTIYGKGLIKKYHEKPFTGTMRDLGSPPPQLEIGSEEDDILKTIQRLLQNQ